MPHEWTRFRLLVLLGIFQVAALWFPRTSLFFCPSATTVSKLPAITTRGYFTTLTVSAIVNAPEQGCSYKGRDKFGKSRSKANSSFTSKRKFLDDQGLYLYPLALAGPELYVLTSGPIQCQLTLPPTCV
jgi:hypothetical protein